MPQTIIYSSGSLIFSTSSLVYLPVSPTGSTSEHPYFANSNPANNVSMSLGGVPTASITFITTSYVSYSVSQSLFHFGDTTTTGSFGYPTAISNSNGTYTSSRFTSFDYEGSASGMLAIPSASLEMGFTPTGEWSIRKPHEANPTNEYLNYEKTFMYVSKSGKLGFKTTDPKNDIDFKADNIKFRSDDGTKEMEFRGGRIITKKYRNIAVGGAVTTETSGSELVMAYSPGTFLAPSTASEGDRLGTITWEDLSISSAGSHEDATAMEIYGKVDGVASDGSAIKGSMHFGIGASQAGEPVRDYLVISEGQVSVTASNMTMTGQRITIGNVTDGDSDKYLSFLTSTSTKRWVAGVDISADAFVIDKNHSANIPSSGQDFIFYGGGGLTIGGNLSCLKVQSGQGATEVHMMDQNIRIADNVTFAKVTTANMPAFTGSVIAIDGGNF